MRFSINQTDPNGIDQSRTTIVDFFNYYCSGGPLEAVGAAKKTAARLSKMIPVTQEMLRHRQELGGIFTSDEELLNLPGFSERKMAKVSDLVALLDCEKLSALSPCTTWDNHVEAFMNGPECLNLLLEEIGNAKHYIHLSVMLFYNDFSGNKIIQALINALSRGVIVRVMADYGVTAIGYGDKPEVGDFKSLAEQLQAHGGKVINTFKTCYSSMEWTKKRKELEQAGVEEGTLFLQDLLPVGRGKDLNICNHRKFIIIDGVTCILGSLNIGDQYLFETPVNVPATMQSVGSGQGIPRNEEQWHDGCIRIQGAFILPVNRLFRSQWIVLGGDLFDPGDSFYYPDMERKVGAERCTLMTCFPGNPVNLIQKYFDSLIRYASSETIIVNPYLISDVFWDALKSIGSEASLHLSLCNSLNVNDHVINKMSVRCNMYKPFRNGVSFYDYSKTGRFSHWKITYEERTDCVFHGSFNLNTRSALHDFEMGVLIKSKPFAKKAKALIDFDLACSEKISSEKLFFKYPRLHPSNYVNDSAKYFS